MNFLTKIDFPLVAILRGIYPEEVIEHAKAMYEIGFRLIEVPTNSPNWEKSVQLLVDYFGDKALIGAGTVITEEHYESFKKTGGRLLVTPNFNPTIVRAAIADNITTCIGAFSVTEVVGAAQEGVSIVKIFPAGNAGLEYCKSILTIAPRTSKYYCVGGVNRENLTEFLDVGFHGAGLGSDLYKPGQSVDTTKENAQVYFDIYKNYKNENNRD